MTIEWKKISLDGYPESRGGTYLVSDGDDFYTAWFNGDYFVPFCSIDKNDLAEDVDIPYFSYHLAIKYYFLLEDSLLPDF